MLVSEKYIAERKGMLMQEVNECIEKVAQCKDPIEMGRIARLGNTSSARLDELAMLVRASGAGDV